MLAHLGERLGDGSSQTADDGVVLDRDDSAHATRERANELDVEGLDGPDVHEHAAGAALLRRREAPPSEVARRPLVDDREVVPLVGVDHGAADLERRSRGQVGHHVARAADVDRPLVFGGVHHGLPELVGVGRDEHLEPGEHARQGEVLVRVVGRAVEPPVHAGMRGQDLDVGARVARLPELRPHRARGKDGEVHVERDPALLGDAGGDAHGVLLRDARLHEVLRVSLLEPV